MAVTTRLRAGLLALRESRGRLLGTVAAGWFLVLGMRFVIPAILPTIRAEYGITNATAGIAVTVLWLAYAGMQFPTGVFIDRVGERVLLVSSMALSTIGLFAYSFSPVFGLFLAATVVFGLGTGLYGPTRGTVLSRCFADREGVAFGTVLAAGSAGAALLPFLAVLALERVGWRVALGAAAPLFLVVGIALWTTVPPRPAARTDRALRSDVEAAVRSFRDRQLLLAVAGATLMLFGFQGVTAFLTTYLFEQKGLSQGLAGGLLSLLFVGGAVAQPATGALADRFGTPRVLAGVAFVSVFPLVALPLLDGTVALALASFVIGFRMSSGPLSNAYIVDVLPDEIEGTAWGLLRTSFFVVGSFGSVLVGYLADWQLFDGAFYVLAGLTAIAVVVYSLLPERE
jgi:predicted MFS family arabinose efflux permease